MTKHKIQNNFKFQISKQKPKIFFVIWILSLFCHLDFVICHSSSFAQIQSQEDRDFFVAQKSFDDGLYDTSIKLFEGFLIDYPYSPRKIEASLYIAKSLFLEKKYSESLSKFQKFFSIPEAAYLKDEVLFWIAEVYFKTRDYRNASYYYQRLITEFPQSKYKINAHYSNGFCFYMVDNYKEAIKIFTFVKQNFPDDPLAEEAGFKIIECFYNLKDFKNLELALDDFLKIHPDTKKINYIYYYRAELNYYLGNFKQASSDFKMCLDNLQGDNFLGACVNLGLGWVYLKIDNFKEAEAAFSRVDLEFLNRESKDSLFLGKAILCAKSNKFEEAISLFDSVIQNSKDPLILIEAYAGKGELLYDSFKYEEAVLVYKKAIAEFGNNKNIDLDKLYYNLAWAYLKLGNFKEATLEFQKVIKQSTNRIIKVSALCQLADAYQDQGNYEEAIAKYDEILRDYPDNFYSDYAQYQLGISLLKSDKYDSAILAFTKLISDFQNSKLKDSSLYSLGLAYFKKGDFLKSKEYFINLFNNFPDSKLRYDALYLAGVCFYNQSNFIEAIKIFKSLLREKKVDSNIIVKAEYEIADCYLRLGDEKEALRRFRALNAKYPDSFLADDVLFWLGEYFLKELKFSFARRYFFTLIEKYPKSPLIPQGYYNIGYSYVEEGNLGEAKKIFLKLKKDYKDKNAILAQIALIDIDVEEGRLSESIEEYNKLLEYNSEFSKLIYLKLADTYRKTKRFDKALEVYKKIERENIDPYIEFQIAECFEERKDFANAIKQYLAISYSYPDDKALVLKCLLRTAKLFEEKEQWLEAKNIYDKVSHMDFEEAKFAKEKIIWINSFTKNK